jgi:hypothetical protein
MIDEPFDLDSRDPVVSLRAPCWGCRHYLRTGPNRRCEAFEGRIPEEIWNGSNPHTAPVEGDHGLTFEPREGR